MTATAEERKRAAEIWADADLAETVPDAEVVILKALRRAENEKLEEAALWADKWLKVFGKYQPEQISPQRWATDAVKDIAAQIRSLKKD